MYMSQHNRTPSRIGTLTSLSTLTGCLEDGSPADIDFKGIAKRLQNLLEAPSKSHHAHSILALALRVQDICTCPPMKKLAAHHPEGIRSGYLAFVNVNSGASIAV
jgi:hypothetical protein